MLEYTADNGKTVMLNGDSQDACQASCKSAPELQDKKAGEQSKGAMAMDIASGGEQKMMAGCLRFCQLEFEIECFPASSTVVVRDQGRVPLSKVKVGDEILVIHRGSANNSSDWVLHFEPVLSWLHYEPDAEINVIQVRHGFGGVSLTPDHMIFTRKCGSGCVEAVLAREIHVGDRVVSPWIDGSLAETEVVELTNLRASGAYAPLVASGIPLVDSTAVSCYAIPNDLWQNSTYASFLRGMRAITGRESAHEIAHTLFLPIRLLCQRSVQKRVNDVEAVCDSQQVVPAEKNSEAIHPYGLFLYVLCKSFII